MSLVERNVPSTDLSDLNAPAAPQRRGGGSLANLVGQPTPSPGPDEAPAGPVMAPPPADTHAPATPAVVAPVAPPVTPLVSAPVTSSTAGSVKKGKPINSVYVAEGVKKRFEKYRYDHKLTNVQVVLQAVADQREALAQVIKESRYDTAPVNPLFPSDPKTVKYLGGGSAAVTFKPTVEQAEVLDEIGGEIGFDKRSTWLAPVLNSFLPGKRETRRE
ncbi:hypothetical protein ONA92_26200 [Mycobacteroides salmoniphilum]|uniref:hypothetical protein n=1 Tax=Mycobacteroides salmoniphilum TaxID=404941 RepID=UPI00356306F0